MLSSQLVYCFYSGLCKACSSLFVLIDEFIWFLEECSLHFVYFVPSRSLGKTSKYTLDSFNQTSCCLKYLSNMKYWMSPCNVKSKLISQSKMSVFLGHCLQLLIHPSLCLNVAHKSLKSLMIFPVWQTKSERNVNARFTISSWDHWAEMF